MSIIDPSVSADWGAWTAPLEGRVATLYKDTKSLFTTGLGCLLPNLQASQALPWLCFDGSTASPERVARDWAEVAAMRPGLHFRAYAARPAALHLTDEAIDTLARVRLEADAAQLARAYPDFATWPAPAQRATLSMAWAMGAGFPATWPRFSAAVRARDWVAAAANCKIDETGEAGVVPRNKLNRALFEEAASQEAQVSANEGHRVDGGVVLGHLARGIGEGGLDLGGDVRKGSELLGREGAEEIGSGDAGAVGHAPDPAPDDASVQASDPTARDEPPATPRTSGERT